MKYCHTATSGQTVCSTYPVCLEEFNVVIVREGYVGAIPFFTNSEEVINCDTLEIEISKAAGNPALNSSMDVAFGISDTNNAELVLVEIRLNYTNPNNVSSSKLFQKVNGT